MKKKSKWMKARHSVVTTVGTRLIYPWVCGKYGVSLKAIPQKEKRQYLILMNHQTPFDQFFIALTFRWPVYYLATEDIFSLGFLSKILRYLVAPIPIKKQTMDIQAVLNCIRIAKEGGTIALAPEGNRTYSGRTGYIKPSVVQLVRKLGLPLALFRIEGGYGTAPRWSDDVRKDTMKAYVSRVMEPEEYKEMDDDTLYSLICQELYVDEAVAGGNFVHSKAAQYLERMVYTCPVCGLSPWESHGDICRCLTCGMQVRYRPDKTFEGIGCEFPYRFAADWYDAQCAFVNRLDLSGYVEMPMFRDTVNVFDVELYHKKKRLHTGAEMALYGDRITVRTEKEMLVFPYDSTGAVTVLGRNKLNIYADDKVYQFKGSKGFNALKYVNMYHRAKNLREGSADEQFLGL